MCLEERTGTEPATRQRTAIVIAFDRNNGGLAAVVGIGLIAVCLSLGFWLAPLVASATQSDESAVELVSTESLEAAGGRPVVNARIAGFQFSPPQIEVSPGTAVLWTNQDGVDHDVTLRESDVASPLVGRGGKIAVVFREPGKYRYYCGVHPFMQGTVIVE